MGTYTARDRARAALVSLAGGTPDSVSFRHEAIAILHRAIGVDGWGWLLTDPGARLPVHVSVENRVVDQALRRFFRMLPQAWNEPGGPGSQPPRQGLATCGPVTTLSAQTGGDLNRDLSWREVWVPRASVTRCASSSTRAGRAGRWYTCTGIAHARTTARKMLSSPPAWHRCLPPGSGPTCAPRALATLTPPRSRGRSSWTRTSPWSPPPSRPGGGSTAWRSRA
jgi:hypothetical protein